MSEKQMAEQVLSRLRRALSYWFWCDWCALITAAAFPVALWLWCHRCAS